MLYLMFSDNDNENETTSAVFNIKHRHYHAIYACTIPAYQSFVPDSMIDWGSWLDKPRSPPDMVDRYTGMETNPGAKSDAGERTFREAESVRERCESAPGLGLC